MAEQSQNVNFQPVAWNEQAAVLLHGAAGNDPTYTMDDLRREVIDGHATLYLVSLGADALGYLVMWVDDFGRTKELVVQAGEAFANHSAAARVTLPQIERFARDRGCATMRTHLAGASRFLSALKRAGWRKTEIVMKKGVV